MLRSVQTTARTRIAAIDIVNIVHEEQEILSQEWNDPANHLLLAPGEEILTRIFGQFGAAYTKRTDAVSIAKAMSATHVEPELKTLITQAAALAPRSPD